MAERKVSNSPLNFVLITFGMASSENILTFPEDCDKYLFPNLRTLICGAMKLTWDDIIKLSAIFPGIEELRAISNEITHLDTPPENNFKNVRILDLEGNAIREWSEICKLGVMPNLQHMILENIQISNIKFENCGGQQLPIFQNVLRLALSNNLIDNVKRAICCVFCCNCNEVF